jgi:hypothetical protein
VLAPPAPGSIGRPADPGDTQRYLQDLDAWVRTRRTELDEVDAAAAGAGRASEITSDMTLSMALWQAVSERYRLLSVTFDGGRVGPREAQQLSTLIWGRLDGTMTDSALAVSLPEACRLSDALAGQLRTRLALVPGADASAARVRQLRAQLERLRDQVALEPASSRDAASATWGALARRVDDVTERARRGADVGGLLGPLEQDAALAERDLIVGNAQRRGARDQVRALRELRADLEAREQALTTLAATCRATVSPAPRYAVPDVSALGPVPDTPAELTPYAARLDRVSRAMTLAQHDFAAALDEHTGLRDLLEGYEAKARALGVADQPDLVASAAQAHTVLARRPAPLAVARQLVTTYQTWLDQLVRDTPRSVPAPAPVPGSTQESA